MKFLLFLIAGFLITNSPATATQNPASLEQINYTAITPLKAIYSEAEVAVYTAKLNNWLNANIDRISEDRLPQIREHLYYLINSHNKNQYGGVATAPIGEPDLILATLFSWAERLGVYGGSMVYEAVKPLKMGPIPSSRHVPDSFTLTFENGMLQVGSKTGAWHTRVPYYFMVGDLRDFTANNGQQTQLAIISTGSAHHEGKDGHSQATLMLIYTADSDEEKFKSFWTQQFGMSAGTTKLKIPSTPLTSDHILDEATALHKEFVSWPTSNGVIGVAYMGINGTYQHNRPHFSEFLAAIQTK
ncbi:hypothetical protein ACFO5Q_13155 [Kordiimonas lipolytica]|uniref:Uncharacterized protein n=1 Tax=Kordiimonas lipolytica TaxID=1662421 RepID=A0ABV8UD74_9PROT|nr:hypothetical protein [Kordiimonas lipolytica]